MQVSASIDFDEFPESGLSNDSLSELSSAAATPPPLPEIKFRVPSTPKLDTDNIVLLLKPYESIIDQIQALILWRRPIQFGLFIILFELSSLIVYLSKMGFFSFIIFLVFLYFIGYSINLKYHNFIVNTLFPPIESRGNQNETNKLYSLYDLSSFLSVIGSRFHTFFLGCKQKACDMNIFGQFLWVSFLFCFFVLAVIVRTFPLFYLFSNILIFLPGIIFHPSINPSILPYLQRLMMTIAPKIKDE